MGRGGGRLKGGGRGGRSGGRRYGWQVEQRRGRGRLLNQTATLDRHSPQRDGAAGYRPAWAAARREWRLLASALAAVVAAAWAPLDHTSEAAKGTLSSWWRGSSHRIGPHARRLSPRLGVRRGDDCVVHTMGGWSWRCAPEIGRSP